MRYHLPSPIAHLEHVRGCVLPTDHPLTEPCEVRRYRVGPWLVAVLTLLIMLAAAAGIVAVSFASVRDGEPVIIQTPTPSPGPCPTGGPPPCPR